MDLSPEQKHKLHELKKEAILYYRENKAPEKMEESLNKLFYDKPDCIYGYLSNFFEEFAKQPLISHVSATSTYDTRGIETIAVHVDCNYRNKTTRFATAVLPLEIRCYDHERQEEKDAEGEERKTHVAEAMKAINDGFLKDVAEQNFDPRQQYVIDAYIITKLNDAEEEARKKIEEEETEVLETEESQKLDTKPVGSAKKKAAKGKEIIIIPDEPREGLFPGCMAIGTLSVASALAGAKASKLPVYRHIRNLYDAGNSTWRLPQPMIAVLSSGKSSPGKNHCIKEYLLMPNADVPFRRVLPDIMAVCQSIVKAVSIKAGTSTRFINEVGCPNISIDRPEVGFDLINDALTKLEIKDDYKIVLNIAGHELFDYEKGKYELMQGTLKSAEELADFFEDILNKQPAVVGLIDPMRKVEKDAWMKLCERVSDRCLIIGDCAWPRPGVLLHHDMQPDFQSSGWCLRLHQRNTVTEALEASSFMVDAKNHVVVAAGSYSDGSLSPEVDFAVGLGARFIKVGCPLRSEKCCKLLRLREVGEELDSQEELSQWELLDFPTLKRPVDTALSEKSQTSLDQKEATGSKTKLKK